MKLTQAQLSSVTSNGRLVMTCWLPSGNLKIGMIITLKNLEGKWKIEELYHTTDSKLLNIDWKVGGL